MNKQVKNALKEKPVYRKKISGTVQPALKPTLSVKAQPPKGIVKRAIPKQ